ncbi:hypothetical protein GPECTOR_61g781 [Gonium pectorale]|uniref:Mediator of RNA polymerase II transcription subunit 21 n=1 Tax=Gonium pectorale TaxID=33097 RepID=A0A150G4S9_GONPE|nr:hypothetical protein GPECTOR_61g781 [Gonium pectorale]|eukprot:KXZ44828.1 hypothetical protein GPECTOR_61g781 [Gonium pectorale]
MRRFKDINTLIDKLPDLAESPEQQDARIEALLKEHHALRQELGIVMQEAEQKLEEVHGCYDVLAQHSLAQAGKLGGGRP